MPSENERQVVVHGTAKDFRQEVTWGPFHLIGDEPLDIGGGDTGPGPYEYLLIALGTCTSMTIGMIARQRGWSVTGVKVTLRHDRIHAEDCKECETKRGMVEHIVRDNRNRRRPHQGAARDAVLDRAALPGRDHAHLGDPDRGPPETDGRLNTRISQ